MIFLNSGFQVCSLWISEFKVFSKVVFQHFQLANAKFWVGCCFHSRNIDSNSIRVSLFHFKSCFKKVFPLRIKFTVLFTSSELFWKSDFFVIHDSELSEVLCQVPFPCEPTYQSAKMIFSFSLAYGRIIIVVVFC